MKTHVSKMHTKLLKHKSELDVCIEKLEELIQEHSDCTMFIQYQPSDGFLVVTDDYKFAKSVPVGMSLYEVIKLINDGERLTLDTWNPIG